MARQNIDEEWKTDPRRTALIKRLGHPRLADGMRVEVNWMVLDHKGKPIPLKKFKFIENYEDWIECGLAEIRGEEVHISGADRYQEFFDKQNEFVEKASEAGKKSAEVRKKKYGTAQPKGGKGAKKPKVNRTEPNGNRTEPNFSSSFSFSSSSSSSFSSSFSGSASDSENTPPGDGAASPNPPSARSPIQIAMAEFIYLWEQKNRAKFSDRDKLLGALKSKIKSEGLERTLTLIRAYFQIPDAWVVKQAWSVGGFTGNISEIARFADSGTFVSRKQMLEVDESLHYRTKNAASDADEQAIGAILEAGEAKRLGGMTQ